MKFLVETIGKPTVLQHWKFVGADESGSTIHSILYSEDGTLLQDMGESTSTWEELEGHAHFPRVRTTRTESVVETALGRHNTWLFVVQPTKDSEPVQRIHFAANLPGPPVLTEMLQGDVVIMKMTMLERR